jgi:hypothetical protein
MLHKTKYPQTAWGRLGPIDFLSSQKYIDWTGPAPATIAFIPLMDLKTLSSRIMVQRTVEMLSWFLLTMFWTNLLSFSMPL